MFSSTPLSSCSDYTHLSQRENPSFIPLDSRNIHCSIAYFLMTANPPHWAITAPSKAYTSRRTTKTHQMADQNAKSLHCSRSPNRGLQPRTSLTSHTISNTQTGAMPLSRQTTTTTSTAIKRCLKKSERHAKRNSAHSQKSAGSCYKRVHRVPQCPHPSHCHVHSSQQSTRVRRTRQQSHGHGQPRPSFNQTTALRVTATAITVMHDSCSSISVSAFAA